MSQPKNHFTSKSNVLKFLSPQLKKSKIEKIFDFTVKEWEINSKNILNEVDMDFNNVLKSSIFLSDMSLFSEVNEIYGSYLESGKEPARETIAVKTLPMNVNVEISMIASI